MAQTMTTSVKAWGNSQGIRLSKEVMSLLDLRLNDTLSMEIQGEALVLRKAVRRKTLEEYAADYGGTLGPYGEFDWGEGIGIERWIHAED